MSKEIEQAALMLKTSKNTVVVTGAGISTEAGIPDFRGENGIYRRLGEEKVMQIINSDCFRSNPDYFYLFYRQNFQSYAGIQPSRAHLALAELEQKGLVKAIVTQNIDGLHQKAGSRKVFAIHGSADRYICTNRSCQEVYDQQYVDAYPLTVPCCEVCDAILKPDVVLFGEPIKNYYDAVESITGAHLLVVIGSSLTVYPLAGFVRDYCNSNKDLLIINKGPTQLDYAATLKVDTDRTGDFLNQLLDRV
ncbi:MAG: NAD-dependent deacylase [Syntrophomonadaceae bacterium]